MDAVRGSSNQTCIFGQEEMTNSGLPDELLLRIFSFLDIYSLAAIGASCKKLNALSEDSQLWKPLYMNTFPEGSLIEEANWKSAYKARMQIELAYLQIPFPGERGIFHPSLNKGSFPNIFSTSTSISPISIEIELINDVKSSFISDVKLLGYKNGNIALSINVPGNKELFGNYLKSIDPSEKLFNSFTTKKGLYITDFNLMKKMFRILKHFNTIPQEFLSYMRGIIWAENLYSVFPFLQKMNSKSN